MQRHGTFPTETAKECGALIFLVGGKGCEAENQKIGEGQRGKWNGNHNEQAMILFCLQQKSDGRNDIGHMRREGEFTETPIKKAERRDGIQHDENEG